MAELGTEGSFDGSQRVVIRGKFAQKVGMLNLMNLHSCGLPVIFYLCVIFCICIVACRVFVKKIYHFIRSVPNVPIVGY